MTSNTVYGGLLDSSGHIWALSESNSHVALMLFFCLFLFLVMMGLKWNGSWGRGLYLPPIFRDDMMILFRQKTEMTMEHHLIFNRGPIFIHGCFSMFFPCHVSFRGRVLERTLNSFVAILKTR